MTTNITDITNNTNKNNLNNPNNSANANPRIINVFNQLNGKTALIPYITAGDPSINATVNLMHALVDAGSDIIELGVPFSDPMADGPVIQRAAGRAIERGTSLYTVFDMVTQFRQTNANTPVVLMGYANPIERMGQAKFVQLAKQAGVDGVLVVDYPPEEITTFSDLLTANAIDPIFLLAPTSSDERIQQVAALASGYIYYVSLKGVTGSGALDVDDVKQRLEHIRKYVSIPVGVGFGIRDANSAKKISECASAVVIGSKIIETMENAATKAKQDGLNEQQCEQAAINAAAGWLQTIRDVL